MKTILIILFISTSAFSFSKRKCAKNLDKVQQIDGFKLESKICDNKDFRDSLLKNLDDYNTCLANVSDVIELFPRPYTECSKKPFRRKLNNNDYVLCGIILLNNGLNKDVDSVCRLKSKRKIVLLDEFSTCMDKTASLSSVKSYNICKNEVKRSVVLSQNFNSCVKKKKPRDKALKVERCANVKVLTAEMKQAMAKCDSEVSALNIKSSACNDDEFRDMKNKQECLFDASKVVDLNSMSKFEFKDFYSSAKKDCSKKKKLKDLENVAFINSQYFLTGMKVGKHELGGLSALAFDDKSENLYIVSDDQGFHGPSRIIKANITSDDSGLKVNFLDNILLRKYKKLDAEGLQIDRDGHLIVSSETLDKKSKTLLRRFDTEGDLVNEITTPEEYKTVFEDKEEEYIHVYQDKVRTNSSLVMRPRYRYVTRRIKKKRTVSIQKKGILKNKGFEALTLSLDKEYLYVASEQQLAQDKDNVRILKLKANSDDFEKVATFLYKIDKGEGNGLVEMVEIEDNILLALERRYDAKKEKIISNIYKIDLSNVDPTKPVEKEDFLNLDDLVSYLPNGLKHIDNIEGMGIGPKLKNGNRTLILVSDNNFSYKQKTQFIYLELK